MDTFGRDRVNTKSFIRLNRGQVGMEGLKLGLYEPYEGVRRYALWRGNIVLAEGDVAGLRNRLNSLGQDAIELVYVREQEPPVRTVRPTEHGSRRNTERA